MSTAVGETVEQLSGRLEKLREEVEATESRARDMVRRHPLGALAAALLGGYVAARLVNRA